MSVQDDTLRTDLVERALPWSGQWAAVPCDRCGREAATATVYSGVYPIDQVCRACGAHAWDDAEDVV